MKKHIETTLLAIVVFVFFLQHRGFRPACPGRRSLRAIEAGIGPKEAVLVADPSGKVLFSKHADRPMISRLHPEGPHGPGGFPPPGKGLSVRHRILSRRRQEPHHKGLRRPVSGLGRGCRHRGKTRPQAGPLHQRTHRQRQFLRAASRCSRHQPHHAALRRPQRRLERQFQHRQLQKGQGQRHLCQRRTPDSPPALRPGPDSQIQIQRRPDHAFPQRPTTSRSMREECSATSWNKRVWKRAARSGEAGRPRKMPS